MEGMGCSLCNVVFSAWKFPCRNNSPSSNDSSLLFVFQVESPIGNFWEDLVPHIVSFRQRSLNKSLYAAFFVTITSMMIMVLRS
jgi:hypothetical protein